MNTYNENLHSGIVNTLQAQLLNQQKLKSTRHASLFTLYYAEGATITATENLALATQVLDRKKLVKKQAVHDSNLCNNVLASATQANTFLKQSVTNIAVAAANVQVASNAIVKLASDTSSVFSIINAADFGSSIYNLALEAQGCMTKTASEAEQASKLAMEASWFTAEVSGPTVLDKAKSTNSAMGNILKIVSVEFNSVSQAVVTDNANLASVSVKEKAAEGVYEDISADCHAAWSAYRLTNKELNLNLLVDVSQPTTSKPDHMLTVSFNAVQTPFPKDGTPKLPYPVSSYNIIVAKDQNKYTFSAAKAENVAEDYPKQFVGISMPGTTTPPAAATEPATAEPAGGTSAPSVASQPAPVPNPYAAINGNAVTVTQVADKITCTFKYSDLADSDGDTLKLGVNYVVFVMAVYCQDYKKKLNVFDDFISAPSATFTIATQLPKPTGITEAKNVINYTIGKVKAAVRVMFLPFPKDVSGMLTVAGYEDLDKWIEKEKAAGPKKEGPATDAGTETQAATDSTASSGTGTPAAENPDIAASPQKLDFIFNMLLAEQVTAANYISANYDGTTKQAASITILPDTTDNFGKPLIPGETYMPVVLAMPANEYDTQTPNMSDLDTKLNFVYKP